MSRTSRAVTPGWNPDHPRWCFDDMTPKYHTRDRRPVARKGKFAKGLRNSRYNLKRKNEALAACEAMDDE